MAREAARARLSEAAIGLFDERGFDDVTVEQIAAAVGISARSFHRYFPTKEDAVVGDPVRGGQVVAHAFGVRPADEPVWESLCCAFQTLFEPSADVAHGKRAMRVLMSTASLRARNLEKHLLWAQMLDPLVAARMRVPDGDVRAQVATRAALTCFEVALEEWATSKDADGVTLVRAAFGALVLDERRADVLRDAPPRAPHRRGCEARGVGGDAVAAGSAAGESVVGQRQRS